MGGFDSEEGAERRPIGSGGWTVLVRSAMAWRAVLARPNKIKYKSRQAS